MFCKTSPQLSLFDVNNVFPNALPKEDWCYLYRDQIYPLIDEEIFKELYPGECGRPNRSIKKAVSILIFMGMEKHTWRGAEFQQARRLDWFIATRTPLGKLLLTIPRCLSFIIVWRRAAQGESCLRN